ncbi:Re/Si-specific NAD(P)(+) transhydrogenase subunit alpha [Leucothrix mucor]|uniref:Re/Si-specific NAD(P)(+) transhydrogenase subunit alpha n=1 Tax=Leucothrix mucor TaxID=45248 RepID=UPI0003B2EB8C|nr:Re/Si-specific NAD(P)(+) transhydrogenase subunit alpha [Leucothrix mucor]
MKISVPKEVVSGERRVATTPEVVTQLLKLGYSVEIESGAGEAANFSDAAYQEAGASIAASKHDCWHDADIILKVNKPDENEEEYFKSGQTLISFFWPAQNEALLQRLADKNVNVIAMDAVPRISRAQKMDALSSMANIAGYRAVVEASNHFGRFFTGQITAAGKIPPAKVLVIGAGVAGLSAIGAASSMGAIVRSFDTRPEVKEQVESMGAEFLLLEFEADEAGGTTGGYAKTMSKEFIDAEMALFREQAKEVDIIITTALIPGRPAPKLILADMVELMKPGSVIVDLAAEQGGNCELTEPGEVVVKHGVTLIGYTDLTSRLATQSSQLYGTNLRHMLADLTPEKDGNIVHNMQDDVIRGATVTKAGKITWPPPAISVSAAPAAKAAPAAVAEPTKAELKAIAKKKATTTLVSIFLMIGFLLWVGSVAPPAFMSHLIVFVLAIFVGWQVIWNVSPSLHTPLMSVTNAISGIIVIGAVLQIGSSSFIVSFLAAIAVLIASINIAGGFLVTQRMLRMFSREED